MKKRQSHKGYSRRGANLGQHFLIARWAAKRVAESCGAKEGDTVLEIGPGKGALTSELLATGATVIAVEKDAALVEILNGKFEKEIAAGQLRITTGDIRNFSPSDLGAYSLAANIPYYITGEILRAFLTTQNQPRTMSLLVQKEVADRIVARHLPAGRQGKESILSISVKAYGTPTVIARVPARCFNPPPKVDSAILAIGNISKDFFADVPEDRFFDVVRVGFSSKRKMLAGNLAKKYGRERTVSTFAAANIDEKARAEDIQLAQWKVLTLSLT